MLKFKYLTSLTRRGVGLLSQFRKLSQDSNTIRSVQRFPSNKKRWRNILSFDGGGTKGIMELSLLDDIMRLATIIWKLEPTFLKDVNLKEVTPEHFLKDKKVREKLIEHLKKESVTENLIHPTQVYDMIAGTSTGALIAFGLAGGNIGREKERLPMAVDECIGMYKKYSKKIFSWMWKHMLLSNFSLVDHKRQLQNILDEKFDNILLRDFKQKGEQTIPVAIAREVYPNSNLVSFDSNNERFEAVEVREVLMAATNVPIYYYNPIKIEHSVIVDGGIGGNCPIGQAVPRAETIFNSTDITVLSIAPPADEVKSPPQIFQTPYWLKFIKKHAPDGNFVYENVKQLINGSTKHVILRRLTPRGTELKKFKFYDSNVQKMLDEMVNVKKDNDMFLVDIAAMATFVLYTYLVKNTDYIKDESARKIHVAATFAYNAGKRYEEKADYSNACDSYITSLNLLRLISKPDVKTKEFIERVQIAREHCLRRQGIFEEAERKEESIPDGGTKAVKLLERTIYEIGSKDEAELVKNLEEARKIQLKIGNMPEVARIHSRIAFLYAKNQKYEKAIESEKEALSIRDNSSVFPNGYDRNINKAGSLESLGSYFFAQEKFDQAIYYFEKYLNVICERLGWKHDEGHVKGLMYLGECFYHKEEYKKARSSFQRALAILQGLSIDKNIPLAAELYANIARCLINLDEDDKSLSHANKAVAIANKYYRDVDHPLIVKTLFIRSEIYEKLASNPNFPEAQNLALEDKKSAEEMLERLLENILA